MAIVTMRIGILTLPYSSNYGGVIQAVALSHFLQQLGHETVLLTRRRPLTAAQTIALPVLERLPGQNIGGIRALEQARALLRPTIQANFTTVTPALRSRRQLTEAVERLRLDAVIVGSDQVWRLEYLPPGSEAEFFLDFVQGPRTRKIAYAASFGVGEWMYPDRVREIASLIKKFDAVSVREASGVRICRETFGRADAQHVLDPTLLVDPSFYGGLCGPSRPWEGKRVLSYILDQPPVYSAALAALGAGYSVRSISPDNGRPVDLPSWLRGVRDSDYVITDSFHGTVFSIIFRRPFISILNHSRGADRFESLLAKIGLADRLIAADDPGRVPEIVAREIDYDAVHERIRLLRLESGDFLQAALSPSRR